MSTRAGVRTATFSISSMSKSDVTRLYAGKMRDVEQNKKTRFVEGDKLLFVASSS